MGKILVLTNNVYAEQNFQSMLQVLSHEVYCSKCVLKDLPNELITYFDILLLSETIADRDVLEVLSAIQSKNKLIIRKVDVVPPIDEREEWLERGISGWLSHNSTVAELRESLDEIVRSNKRCFTQMPPARITVPGNVKFSKIEYRIICALLDQEEHFMTRPQLCLKLWNEEASNSRLVQLSTMVNNIRRKLRLEGIEDDAIKTLWNKGYQLSQRLDWSSLYQKI